MKFYFNCEKIKKFNLYVFVKLTKCKKYIFELYLY